jgi:hypothetical protein
MNPVFYQYHRENNILDSLIQEFANRKWLFDEMPDDYFHQFRWPDVVLSDKEAKFKLPGNSEDLEKNYPFTIELLGCYEPAPEKEGRVILFMRKIRETALTYASVEKGLPIGSISESDVQYFIELLSDLILVHEFTHWIIHRGISPDLNSEKRFDQLQHIDYETIDNIQFHETAAQVLTNFICSKHSDLWELFLWLSNLQPKEYNIYRELLWDDLNSKNKVSDLELGRFIGLLDDALQFNIQLYSFLVLNNLLYMQSNLYQTALKDLDMGDIFIDELSIDGHENMLAASRYNSQIGTLIVIYKLYIESLFTSDKEETLRLKIEDIFKINYPWILPVLLKKYRGRISGKKFGI